MLVRSKAQSSSEATHTYQSNPISRQLVDRTAVDEFFSHLMFRHRLPPINRIGARWQMTSFCNYRAICSRIGFCVKVRQLLHPGYELHMLEEMLGHVISDYCYHSRLVVRFPVQICVGNGGRSIRCSDSPFHCQLLLGVVVVRGPGSRYYHGSYGMCCPAHLTAPDRTLCIWRGRRRRSRHHRDRSLLQFDSGFLGGGVGPFWWALTFCRLPLWWAWGWLFWIGIASFSHFRIYG